MAETYPSDNELLNLAEDNETGVEYIETGKAPYYLEFRKLLYRLLLAGKRANDLRVFDEGGLNIGVKSGKFWDGATLRSYAGSTNNTLEDNKDNIYVYANSDGTLVITEYTSWPSDRINHIRLAIVTTNNGDITNIVDARDHHAWFAPGSILNEGEFYSNDAGGAASPLALFWDSASPANNDELRIPFYGQNDAAEKVEYAQLRVKLVDVSDGSEDALVGYSRMVAGTLVDQGYFVTETGLQQLSGKTINANSNTISQLTGDECAVQTNSSGGLPVIFKATLSSGNTVQVHDADAPYQYRVIDAWSVAKSADGGSWKLTDGTNNITDVVSVTTTNTGIDRAGSIDDAYHEIGVSGSLSVVGDGTLADVEVYIMAVRVS